MAFTLSSSTSSQPQQELERLEELLVHQAFITAHHRPTDVDVDVYAKLGGVELKKYPSVKRWFGHIASYSKSGKK
jgi:hypothetical protein